MRGRAQGFRKLGSRVFPENTASRAMCRAHGFREVGVYQRHGQLPGRGLERVDAGALPPPPVVNLLRGPRRQSVGRLSHGLHAAKALGALRSHCVQTDDDAVRRWGGAELAAHDPAVCASVREVLTRVGDKWSVLVIGLLGEGTKRFTELPRAIEGVSQRMLTLTVRQLERDGLAHRLVYPTAPPRVDYSLTPLGHTLLEPGLALARWADAHRGDIDAARHTCDSRPRASYAPAQALQHRQRAWRARRAPDNAPIASHRRPLR